MKATFLGTGTSMGIPMIGCDCAVCRSEDARDKRLRTSVWIEHKNKSWIIDTGIDFRQQALRAGIRTVDAVLFTHPHADHIFGMDELRAINFLQKKDVMIYANSYTFQHLKRVYAYVFSGQEAQSDIPQIRSHVFDTAPFEVDGTEIIPLPLRHGNLPNTGFRIGKFAYCTDVSSFPEETYHLLEDLDTLVLGALRNRPHPTHFTIARAAAEAEKIGARQTYLVHMSHEVSHRELQRRLPPHIQPACDGLELEIPS